MKDLSIISVAQITIKNIIKSMLKGRNKRTTLAYKKDFEDFQKFLGLRSRDTAADVLLGNGQAKANALAFEYKNHLKERSLSPATINRRLSALRSLVKFGRVMGIVNWHLDIQNEKHDQLRDTRGTDIAGVKKIFLVTDTKTHNKAVRDRALLHLLFDRGLRRGEAVALDIEDVDTKNGTIAILGKGKTQKVILTVPQPTVKALKEWIKIRGTKPGPLFTNFDRAGKGQRLTGSAVYYIVRNYGQMCDLKTRPHGLRHSAITIALDLTHGNIRAVQRFSRHRDMEMLTVYDDNRQDMGGEVAAQVAMAV
jgi:integrase/recombinase XerC